MTQIPLATPLDGIKVLEFSHTVMGPTAGLVFAELGADVIKVEPAPTGDHTRGLGGFGAGFFAAFNRNKRSLAVDLKRKEGQAVIHRLVPTADVVLENFGPGTMERLGCGYEQLAVLAGLARFVIADITDAMEVRVELHNIIRDFTSLPIQPILLHGQPEFVSLVHLKKFPWLLPTIEYDSQEDLLAHLDKTVVEAVENKVLELRGSQSGQRRPIT
jgi:hypothetical protein